MNSSSSLLFLSLLALSSANNTQSAFKMFGDFFNQCSTKTEMFKCLKIQSLKIMDRALHSNALTIIEGVNLISESRQSKEFKKALEDPKLEKLSSEEIDEMLGNTTARLLDTHKFQINVPKLVAEARKGGGGGGGGRKGYGALFWALAIKGAFLSMAYNGIAVMSGTAIIVGKMALMLTAILGLKKLVSSGHEKTTFEIVKVPKYSESHTHSTSYEDHHDDHYRRSFDLFGRRIG